MIDIRLENGRQATRSYLLLLRFVVVNAVALAILAVLWLQGWVSLVFESDITHLTVVISAVFAVGLAIATAKVWRCSHELNAVRADRQGGETRLRWYRDLTGRARTARAVYSPTACVQDSTRASPSCAPWPTAWSYSA